MKSVTPNVRIGSVWKEADKRFTRHVKVVELVEKPVRGTSDTVPAARLASCTPDGRPTAVKITTVARLSRFGRAGGYQLVQDAP